MGLGQDAGAGHRATGGVTIHQQPFWKACFGAWLPSTRSDRPRTGTAPRMAMKVASRMFPINAQVVDFRHGIGGQQGLQLGSQGFAACWAELFAIPHIFQHMSPFLDGPGDPGPRRPPPPARPRPPPRFVNAAPRDSVRRIAEVPIKEIHGLRLADQLMRQSTIRRAALLRATAR